MMKKNQWILLLLAAVLFSSCQNWFLSSEKAITSVSLDGKEFIVNIEPENRTVNLEVEPCDIRTLTPVFTLSEGATMLIDKPFIDSTPVPVKVIAEDGSESSWNVSMVIQPGISFLLNSQKIVLQAGLIDSTNPELHASYGAGLPYCFFDFEYLLECFIFADLVEFNVMMGGYIPPEYASIDINFSEDPGIVPGAYQDTAFRYSNTAEEISVEIIGALTFQVLNIGEFITATFSGTDLPRESGGTANIQEGFFKLIRVYPGD